MSGTCYFGDCRKTLMDMADQGVKVQACITNPPRFGKRYLLRKKEYIGAETTYNSYLKNIVDVFSLVKDLLDDDGSLWLYADDVRRGNDLAGMPWLLALALVKDGWHLRQSIIWAKTGLPESSHQDRVSMTHAYVFHFSKGRAYKFNADLSSEYMGHSIWMSHHTRPPIAPCIELSTDAGDFILDPFFGKGDIGRAAENLRRNWIGCEIDRKYMTKQEAT